MSIFAARELKHDDIQHTITCRGVTWCIHSENDTIKIDQVYEKISGSMGWTPLSNKTFICSL